MFDKLFQLLASVADVYVENAHVTVGADAPTWHAYESFARGLREQYARILASGITVRQTSTDAGADSGALFRDIEAGFLTVFNGADLPEFHALAADSGILIVGDSGQPEAATLNTIFRVCHDYFGHYASGARNTFAARGELAAFLCHAAMFENAALPALASETICQVAFFYAGEHVRRSGATWPYCAADIPAPADADFIPLPSRPFAPQKNAIGAGAFACHVFLSRARFGASLGELAIDPKNTDCVDTLFAI